MPSSCALAAQITRQVCLGAIQSAAHDLCLDLRQLVTTGDDAKGERVGRKGKRLILHIRALQYVIDPAHEHTHIARYT